MKSRIFSGLLLSLLLIGMPTFAFTVQLVKASGTIYIRADGSINPPTAPISTTDNVTYTLTGNISSDADAIVVERNNIVIDGNEYTLQGTGPRIPDPQNMSKGIDLSSRTNVTVHNIQIQNFGGGIFFWFSSSNIISGNNITNNFLGIAFGSYLASFSFSNIISGNNITNNDYGIHSYVASSNSISGNNITNNDYGIYLHTSSSNSISGNTFTDDGLAVFYSYQNSVENNTVNDKPLVYLEGVANYSVGNAGQVILVGCDSIKVEDLNLSRTSIGAELWETHESIISRNNITNNGEGIYLYRSSSNTVYGNNITANCYGIYLWGGSSNNKFYHNNFINNGFQVYREDSANVWDDGYPSGGNYWSDYSGMDMYGGPFQNETGSDGIGDTPYVIDASNLDNYPLMTPFGTNLLIESLVVRNEGCNVYANDTFVNGTDYYVPVEVTVKSIGFFSASSFNVSLSVYWLNGSLLENCVEWRVLSLNLGENTNVTFNWHPTHTGYYNLTAVADCQNEILESNESDNTLVLAFYPVAVMGDINGDHAVNILDASLMSMAWATHPGDAGWNIKADLNHDGVINILDGIRVATNWGKTWPTYANVG